MGEWLACRGVAPVHVALTWTGSAFHRPVPAAHRTLCGRVTAREVPFAAGEVWRMDYCRLCFGPGAFVRCGVCADMGAVELPELLPCPACRPVEHAAEVAACGLPAEPVGQDHPDGPV